MLPQSVGSKVRSAMVEPFGPTMVPRYNFGDAAKLWFNTYSLDTECSKPQG
jgi:hypothetical protein